MSKKYILFNPLFGFKNNNLEIFNMMKDYFENELIPLLRKNVNNGDELYIVGDMFSGQNITFKTLYHVSILFDLLSSILPTKIEQSEKNNIFKYFPNIKYYVDIEYKNYEIDCLYQIKKEYKKVGFLVINEDTSKFQENVYSPRFGKVKIDNIEDLEEVDRNWVKNNWIELELTENAIKNKLKLDIILSKYNFKKIIYPKDIIEPITINDESFDVEELVKEYIDNSENNEELLDEFKKILEIHRNKFN